MAGGAYESIKKVGMREVVDWIEICKANPLDYIWKAKLQAKLKDWGIDGY